MTFAVDIAVDENGVAVIGWSAATDDDRINPATVSALAEAWSRAESDALVSGIVFAGGARRFLGGVDLRWLSDITTRNEPAALEALVSSFSALLAKVEGSPKPSAAVLATDALDAGFDLALACGQRFVAAESAVRMGFTEGRLGLPPVGGGAIRASAMLGKEEAARLVASAAPIFARAAVKNGLAKPALPTQTDVEAAKGWVLAEAARRHQKPALRAFELSHAPNQSKALDLASATFVDAAFGDVSKGLVATLGLAVEETNRLRRRPAGIPKRQFSKVGVLGAGLMGGGIALVAARAGMEVLLLDVDVERARQGLEKISRQEQELVAAGKADGGAVAATLSRISATDDYAALRDVDIVVEAVFEDRAVKAEATRRAEGHIAPATIFATNTSTLPIKSLAEASMRPDNFIGLHFFSPVPHMPLLEIIRGAATSDATLAAAMDFAEAIAKTPILVNDHRGFYTTRVVMAYQAEAFQMLTEGLRPDLIEQAGKLSGMPVPPLALADAVGLDITHQINSQAAADLGDAYHETPGNALVTRIVEEFGRSGRKTKAGLFDYDENGKAGSFWSALFELVPDRGSRHAPLVDIRDRLLFAQIMETVRCFEEGVINDPAEADLGAILGWGFAPWTGGPMRYITTLGTQPFKKRCAELYGRYKSELLQPSPWLAD